MARDHYIPQCLTRPWHDARRGKESLRYYDFDEREFKYKNSGKLFARHGLNKPETERFLSKYIEDPFAIMQDRIRSHANDFTAMTAEIEAMPKTALAGMYYFQMQRIRDHRHPGGPNHADDLAAKGSGWLDEFTAAVFSREDAFIYSVGCELYFPDTGTFMVPLVDHMPVFVLPLDTGTALAFVDRDMDRTQLDKCTADPEFPTTCSIGLDSVHRVVVPPAVEHPSGDGLLVWRGALTRLFHSISERSIVVGKTAWQMIEPPERSARDPFQPRLHAAK